MPEFDTSEILSIDPAEFNGDAVQDGAFGSCESEICAGFILEDAQILGGWPWFTAAGLRSRAAVRHANVPYSLISSLHDLTMRGFLEHRYGYYRRTDEFIERLRRSAAISLPAAYTHP